MGLAAAAGVLERAGIRAEALDLAVEELDREKVARAGIAALSVPMHTALRLGVRAAARIREINPACHVCFYGLYAALNRDYLLAHTADSVLGPEELEGLVGLVSELAHHGDTETRSPNRGETEGTVRTLQPSTVSTSSTRSTPSRRNLPSLDRYAHLEWNGELRLAGYVEATRGCKHRCRHCPIPSVYHGRFVVVPREVVLEDVRTQVRAGARHVTFGDPDFLNGPLHGLRLVREMRAEFPELTWDMTAKIEHLLKQRSLLPELGKLGCAFIVSAVESVSDAVLRHLDKGHTRADVIEALGLVRQAGVPLRPSLMPFTPWAALEDYLDLLDFVREHDLVDAIDPVQYSIRLLVPPGSLLLESGAMRPHLGALDAPAFSYAWRHPDPRMDALRIDVARLAEEVSKTGEDPRRTFERIQALAHAAAGRPAPAALPVLAAGRVRPPRLTEAWFC